MTNSLCTDCTHRLELEELIKLREIGVEIPNSHVFGDKFPNVPAEILDKIPWSPPSFCYYCGTEDDEHEE